VPEERARVMSTVSVEQDIRDVPGPCARWGNDGLVIREILDRVGDKWSVLVVGTLQGAPMRYTDLQHAIPGISQRMLTLTLRQLRRDGLITRTAYAEVPPLCSTSSWPWPTGSSCTSMRYGTTVLGSTPRKPDGGVPRRASTMPALGGNRHPPDEPRAATACWCRGRQRRRFLAARHDLIHGHRELAQ
jgi:DNA-binding HxlR family transcriptional regulator